MRTAANLLAAIGTVALLSQVGCVDSNRTPRLASTPGGGLSGCVDLGAAPTLEDMKARYVADIHPLFVRDDGGCIACHDDNSGRAMKITRGDDGNSTFLRLRSGGFFALTPGTATTRIVDESMPLGTAWTDDEQRLIERFSCDLQRVDGTNAAPLDEQFPAELMLPYTGEPVEDYDNAFLNYAQLRGRIDVVFDDAWVRDGLDRFSQNISLFGGADYISTFVPARQATAEFLAGLDILADDVCDRAAADGTGPFAGLDLNAAIIDEPPASLTTYEAEDPALTIAGLPDGCRPQAGATRVVLCTNASITAEYNAPSSGDYRLVATVSPQPNTGGAPIMEFRINGTAVASITVPGANGTTTTVSTVAHIDEAGPADISVAFVNDSGDGGDRNLFVDAWSVEGPIAGTTNGGPNGAANAKRTIQTLGSRILQRPFALSDDATVDETSDLYDVLLAMSGLVATSKAQAWAGVCEALLQHPDFLFTRPPTFDTTADETLRERLLLMQAALVLLDRTPTNDELGRFDVGEVTRADLIDAWLASAEHSTSYENRVREILEFDGTPDGEEPTRLWSYIERNDRPLKEILTADYTVDEAGQRIERGAAHGRTGVLTMKGYIVGKPGLPHYNYAARVMTGFMGRVFEVPQAALDARATATATSTVDPTSLCFSCHNVLTPLMHQRQKWTDAGEFRDVFEDGRVIDDSDNGLVEGYPFAGVGMEAFSLTAVKKEAFARRMANAHFLMVFGRLLRLEGATANEGLVYRELFDVIAQGNGTLRDLQRHILLSSSVSSPPVSVDVAPLAGVLDGAP